MLKKVCPVCGSRKIRVFYKQPKVAALNNVVYASKSKALNAPKGEVDLTNCRNCSFIFNRNFNPQLARYTKEYDTSRSYSPVVSEYLNEVANLCVHNFGIKRTKIVEIGSYDGEFLKLLVKKSNSSGIGIDPAYEGKKKIGNTRFINNLFENVDEVIESNVLILRHTLEHLSEPLELLRNALKKINFKDELRVVVEVPDFVWISKKGNYWDVTYEHCNYFTRDSLKNLFILAGIRPINIVNTFADQYIIAYGVYRRGDITTKIEGPKNDITKIFLKNVEKKYKRIDSILNKSTEEFTIWGMSGKGVIFSNLLQNNALERIPFTMDDNKNKIGKYAPVSGLLIVPHEYLGKHYLKNILIMNPIYYQDMKNKLKKFNRGFNLVKI